MDKQKFKQSLKNQFLSFAEDVKKKMAYLQGDEVFDENYYKRSLSLAVGNDLLSMFIAQQNDVLGVSAVCDPLLCSFQDSSDEKKAVSDDMSVSLSAKERDFQERRKYFASRIAALRGVSLPGDYLLSKKSSKF